MRIILASSSPRRMHLLNQARIRVEVVSPKTEEKIRKGEAPQALVKRLAHEKAHSVLDDVGCRGESQEVLVIAADTVVVAPGGKKILGKPKDTDEAEKMLSMISGRTHLVLTGYCLIRQGATSKKKAFSRVVRSRVTMRKLTREMIRAYVASGEPMDKAGAYAAQGFGMNWIESLTGSYTNVVGLPMCELLLDLERRFGVAPEAPVISGAW